MESDINIIFSVRGISVYNFKMRISHNNNKCSYLNLEQDAISKKSVCDAQLLGFF